MTKMPSGYSIQIAIAVKTADMAECLLCAGQCLDSPPPPPAQQHLPLVPPKVYGKEINVTLTLGELGTQSSVL